MAINLWSIAQLTTSVIISCEVTESPDTWVWGLSQRKLCIIYMQKVWSTCRSIFSATTQQGGGPTTSWARKSNTLVLVSASVINVVCWPFFSNFCQKIKLKYVISACPHNNISSAPRLLFHNYQRSRTHSVQLWWWSCWRWWNLFGKRRKGNIFLPLGLVEVPPGTG